MKRGIYIFVALVLFFSSCGKLRLESEHRADPLPKAIDLSLSIARVALTRTPTLDADGSGQFSQGDQLQIVAVSDLKHQAFDYTVGQTLLKWDDLTGFPHQDVTFSGCYPKLDLQSTGVAKFTITNATSEAADLLLAQAVSAGWESTAPISLTFKHAMHRLRISYKSSDNHYSADDLNGVTVHCTAISSCNVNMKTGQLLDAPSAETLEYTATGNNTSLLLVPQATAGVKIKLTIEGKEYEYSLPATTLSSAALTKLESGKSLTVNFDIKKNEAPVISITTAPIAGWAAQGEVEDEIIVD